MVEKIPCFHMDAVKKKINQTLIFPLTAVTESLGKTGNLF